MPWGRPGRGEEIEGATQQAAQPGLQEKAWLSSMAKSPLGGDLFLFANRQRTVLKAIYWDRNGFCLWMKRLEKDRFPWPDDEEAAREITRDEVAMLLRGIDFWHEHKELSYRTVL